MTEQKPLSTEELQEISHHLGEKPSIVSGTAPPVVRRLLATIRDRDATIRRRGELIAWLVKLSSRDMIPLSVGALHDTDKQNATEILAIVAGLGAGNEKR